MKCIKNTKTGKITRVGDDIARERVDNFEDVEFCSKEEWKAYMKGETVETPQDEEKEEKPKKAKKKKATTKKSKTAS